MGCAGCGTREVNAKKNRLYEDMDFHREAFGCEFKFVKGFQLDDKSRKTNMKLLNKKYPKIREEILDQFDDTGPVKPWLNQIFYPDKEYEENIDTFPEVKLEVSHVFGYKCQDVRHSIKFKDDENIIYFNGTCLVLHNIYTHSQVIFGGNELTRTPGSLRCHDNEVTCFDYIGVGGLNLLASGQRGLLPLILVWDVDSKRIINKFFLPKGNKEVGGIVFSPSKRFIAAYGKGETNDFFVFETENKSIKEQLVWTDKTGINRLFGIAWNPIKDEFCLCGTKILNYYLVDNRKTTRLTIEKQENKFFFSNVRYCPDGSSIATTMKGEFFLINTRYECYNIINVCKGPIYSLAFSSHTDTAFLGDGRGNIIPVNKVKESIGEKIQVGSKAKTIVVNKNDMIVGLRNGNIVLRNISNSSSKPILSSHFEGRVLGLEYIPDRYIITTGEDNRIMLWNIETKMCEATGKIDEKSEIVITKDSDENEGPDESNSYNTLFPENQCSQCVAFNKDTGNIAVGSNTGILSIRQSKTELDKVIKTIPLKHALTELSYSPNTEMLAAGTNNGFIYLLNSKDYRITFTIAGFFNQEIKSLDWSLQSSLIQVASIGNEYNFVDVTSGKILEDPSLAKNAEWFTLNSKFGFFVQGVFMGSINPSFIETVSRSNNKLLLASGDEDGHLNIYNFPCFSDNPLVKKYIAHKEPIKRIRFSHDDTKLITIGGNDKSVLVWNINRD